MVYSDLTTTSLTAESPTLLPSPLTKVNYLNVIAYFLNVLITFNIEKFGLPSNQTLSLKYQTLVTPIGSAFAIWGIIFLSQFIFVVCQVLPQYRNLKVIQSGVGYWYVATCLAQVAWDITFANEWIWLSFFCMMCILASLIGLVRSLTMNDNMPNTYHEYWLFSFPFSLHLGWIIAASSINLNLLIVAYNTSSTSDQAQVSMAVITLVLITLVVNYTSVQSSSPNYVIAGTLAWALLGVERQLNNPKDHILELFGDLITKGLADSAFFLSWCFAGVTLFGIIKKVSEIFGVTFSMSGFDRK